MRRHTAGFARVLLPLTSAVLLGTALSGCSTRDGTLPNEVTNALATAFTSGDAAACAALYTDDAVILSEHTHPVRGKSAITQFFKDQVARDILFSTDSEVSLVHGDLAMDQGTYRVRDVRRGMDVEYGDYLNVWRLMDGKWRVFRSMYNVTMAPEAGVSVAPEDDSAPR